MQDYAVQRFGNTRWVANLFLIGDHVAEERHLLDLLKAALTDGLVRRLRGHQQQRSVVPIGGFYRRHEVGNPRPILRHHHRHAPRRAGETIGHHAGVALMRAVVKGNPSRREQIRNRHHGGTDDAKGSVDPVHLQGFDEGFLGGHFHGAVLWQSGVNLGHTRRAPNVRLGPDWLSA